MINDLREKHFIFSQPSQYLLSTELKKKKKSKKKKKNFFAPFPFSLSPSNSSEREMNDHERGWSSHR